MKVREIVDLLLEVDRLEAYPRMGYLMRSVAAPESVAAHSYGMTMWAMLLVDHFPEADAEKTLRMALLHELGEVKLGDIPKRGENFLPAGAKDEAESKIAACLLAPLEELGERYRQLFEEFIAGETLEARLVKAADKLQMMAKVLRYERAGNRDMAEFWNYPPNFVEQDLDLVRALFTELRRRRPAADSNA